MLQPPASFVSQTGLQLQGLSGWHLLTAGLPENKKFDSEKCFLETKQQTNKKRDNIATELDLASHVLHETFAASV